MNYVEIDYETEKVNAYAYESGFCVWNWLYYITSVFDTCPNAILTGVNKFSIHIK